MDVIGLKNLVPGAPQGEASLTQRSCQIKLPGSRGEEGTEQTQLEGLSAEHPACTPRHM